MAAGVRACCGPLDGLVVEPRRQAQQGLARGAVMREADDDAQPFRRQGALRAQEEGSVDCCLWNRAQVEEQCNRASQMAG